MDIPAPTHILGWDQTKDIKSKDNKIRFLSSYSQFRLGLGHGY